MQHAPLFARPSRIRVGRLACTCVAIVLGLLGLLLLPAPSLAEQSVDPYSNLIDQHFASEATASQKTADTSAQSQILALDEAIKKQTRRMAEGSVTKAPPTKLNRDGVWVGLALMLIATLVFRRLVAKLDARVNEWSNSSGLASSIVAEITADEKDLAAFVAGFRNGPAKGPLPAEVVALNSFRAKSPKLLSNLKDLLKKIGTAANSSQLQLLADLRRELHGFKGETGLSELLPAWQTASALEGLVQQLADRPENVTQSTLRTVAGGVDLLEQLCQPGVRADLLNNPPVRLLAVDDDIISRTAVSLSLKKALTPPDLAESGEKALALATMHAYDAIFLDVQMPGMDGFELCLKIRETVPNATTPVVFVTCMRDFDSRTRSVLSGGSDLIGKPFLTFEITVKAITLILQARLRASAQLVNTPDGVVAQVGLLCDHPVVNSLSQVTAKRVLPNGFPSEASAQDSRPPKFASPDPAIASREQMPDETMTHALLSRTATQLGALRDRIQAIFQVSDQKVQQEMLADLYLRLHALIPETDSVKTHPALRMSAAMEGLIKKLLQDPKHCTSSTLFTLATAVDVLHELCAANVKPDLLTSPPIHMLVADDDPVARRAITLALQTSFEKPEAVENGEAALAAAKASTFDVIFLDVQMPRMDGFTTSVKIRENPRNRTTPVVFITGLSDFKSRTQANLSGGNDLIAKPFLTAEVTVKALTFAVRARLRRHRAGLHWQSLRDDLGAEETDSIASSSDRANERREARRRARRFKRARQSWYHPA